MSTSKSHMPSSLEPEHPSFDDGLESQDLSLRQAIRVLRSRYRFILAVASACVLLAVLASTILPVKYKASSTIELKQVQNELGGQLGEVASSLTGTDDLKVDLKTAKSIFQDQALGLEVLERMRSGVLKAPSDSSFMRAHAQDKAPGTSLRDDPKAREGLLAQFEAHLDVEEIAGTRLLQVTFKDKDAGFAADVANAAVDQYIKDTLKRRNASTAESTEWMASQLDALRQQVEAAQMKLVDFQKRSGFIVVPSAGGSGGGSGGGVSAGPQLHSTLLDRLIALNLAYVQAQGARIAQEATYRVLQTGDPAAIDAFAATALSGGATSGAAPGGGSASSGSVGSGSAQQANALSGLVALHQQQLLLKQQLAADYQTYGAKNPRVIDLHNQIDYLDTETKAETARALASVKTSLQIAQQTEAGAKKEVDDLEHQADGINDSGVRLAILQQEADSSRSLYEDLYTKLEESRLAEETQSSNVLVISEALCPATPVFPKWGMNIAGGILVGLVLGAMFAFLRESLDETISTSLEIENLTHAAVIGIIPKFQPAPSTKNVKPEPVAGEAAPQQVGVMGQRNSEAGEAYRELRTTIQLSQAGSPPRRLLVTSPLPGDGKSTTCYNLAAGFALLNKRVLLLDADMRKPSLHKRTGVLPAKGLSSLLTSSIDLASIVLPVPGVENLFFLGAGPLPPNPAELLTAPPFAKVIEDASEQFDLVIIDSPPALMVSDSSIISGSVDGVVIVACAGKSTRTALQRTLRNLRRHHAKVLGVVLNMVNTKSSEYYYAYGYYGGKYYGEESNEQKKS
ncbi:MAG: polysaccharide biosynthesis tyrosine autokinase [Terracidiphilus sp.]|nr:polysaccharide biosynthesis tyrosine autokinase [Terracidiphilus sp.]